MKKIRILAAVSLLGVTVAGCTAPGADDDLRTVNVGHVQLPIFAPLYVADAKGYFVDEGIEINLETVQSGQDAIPLASSGQLDVVAAGFSAGLFSAVDTGLDVTVVGSMGVSAGEAEEPPSALVVAQWFVDSGEYNGIADLEGQDIGALGGVGATSAFFTSLALNEVGLGINDVNFIQLSSPDIPTALESGAIAAAFVSAPFWSLAVDDGIAQLAWVPPEGTSGTGVLYSGQFMESDLAQPFFNALARAAADLQGEARYTDEHLQMIGDATNQTAEQVAAVPLYTWLPDLNPLPEQLAAMESAWLEVGALVYDSPLPPESYVDQSFSENTR